MSSTYCGAPWGQDFTTHHAKKASLPMNFTALVRLTADVTSGHAMFIVPFVQQTAAVKMFRVKISSFYLLYIHTAKKNFCCKELDVLNLIIRYFINHTRCSEVEMRNKNMK